MFNRHSLLNEFSDGYAAPRGKTAAVSLDTVYFVKGFGREVRRAAARAAYNGDVFDNQQAGALAVASRQMKDLGPASTAVLTAECRLSLASPHRPLEYTGCQAV